MDSHATDVTDASGVFTVAVPDGSSDQFVVDIHAEGWVPQSSGVLGTGSVGNSGASDGPTESVLVALESQGASISGSVESPTGSGMAGITVLIAVKTTPASTGIGGLFEGGPGTGGTTPWVGDTFRIRTRTDSQGRYSVSGLPPGDLAVVAIKRGIRILAQRLKAAEGSTLMANFVLPQ